MASIFLCLIPSFLARPSPSLAVMDHYVHNVLDVGVNFEQFFRLHTVFFQIIYWIKISSVKSCREI